MKVDDVYTCTIQQKKKKTKETGTVLFAVTVEGGQRK
jgi:hypothetical protein